MAGLGTSVIFVAGLQLLVVAGPVASWCGIICDCEVTQWWWQASAGFKHSVWTPMVFRITPKLERRSGMVGLGTSIIFVAGLQLLVVAGPVASWCGIICVQ